MAAKKTSKQPGKKLTPRTGKQSAPGKQPTPGISNQPLRKTGKLYPQKITDLPAPRNSESFFDSVFQVARLIPKGRVTTYGAIAAYLGSKLSARMVGWAMNAAGSAESPVPAHRVVNRNGMLSGKHHFATPTLMEELLSKEKILVKEDKVEDFKNLFWDPTELDKRL